MDISTGEKLIILMLCDMQKKREERELDPEFIQRAILHQHEWALAWKYPGVFEGEDYENPREVLEVADILDMWEIIESCYADFNEKEKQYIAEKADPFGKNPTFAGFDGNHEGEHYGIVRFLVGPLNRWSRFKGRQLNSHMPSIEIYRRMLRVFDKIKTNKNFDYTFTPDDIAEMLKARRHDYQFTD